MKKSIVTMGLVVALSMATTISALADEYTASCSGTNYGTEYTVSFSGNFSPDGTVVDSGITMTVGENSTYNGKLYYVYDENATLTMNQEKTSGISGIPFGHWGYLDGQKFISTDPFESQEAYGYTMMDKIQTTKAYPIIQPEQLAKDKTEGTSYTKIYGVEINGINAQTHSDEYLYYFFQISPTQP